MNKIIEVNLPTSVITIYINTMKFPVKIEIIKLIKTTKSSCLQETHLKHSFIMHLIVRKSKLSDYDQAQGKDVPSLFLSCPYSFFRTIIFF